LKLEACSSKNDAMNDAQQEDRPPLFPKWNYWYALVIGFLGLLILFFYFFTKHYA
jgi:hypothetical protein